MCGIAGVIGEGARDKLHAAALRMIHAQTHRGPDDEGLTMLAATEPACHVILGSRRLSIIDLSPAGHQPMTNEDGTVWVTYNGEIYNFLSLRERLLSKGHRFKSHTDTEVIVHLYEEYGEDCFVFLRGMFAIALWDQKNRRLVLARDRFGEKPLYFAWDGRRFLFASEVKALLASGLIERKLNPTAVTAYLAFGSVPAPLTIIEGIQSLGPGCLLTFEDGEIDIRRFWNLAFEEDPSLDEGRAAEGVREYLREAVHIRLLSDVPVGAFLSGGIDSSAVVALMRERLTGNLRTFSLAFEQPEFNEGPFARLIAERFETDHTEHVVTGQEVLNELGLIIAAMDQPSVDGVNSYFVSKLTRSTGTIVALSGLGGDELFGGYSSFWLAPKLCRMGRLMEHVKGSKGLVRLLIGCLTRDGRGQKLQAFLRRDSSPETAYLAVKGLFLDDALEEILSDGFKDALVAFDPLQYLRNIADGHFESVSNRISRLELRTYLHNQLLRDTDAMSMAHSLEVRAPFLDHMLVEFVARIPSKVKFDSKPKRLLIKAMAGKLPAEVIERPKGAFAFPFERWLKREWRPVVEEVLLSTHRNGYGLFDKKGVGALWQAFLKGHVRWSRLWAVLMLKLWIRHHIEGVTGIVLSADSNRLQTVRTVVL